MTGDTFEDHKINIDSMCHEEMAWLFRFAPVGHIYFNNNRPDIVDYFCDRFKKLGGMNPTISKLINDR